MTGALLILVPGTTPGNTLIVDTSSLVVDATTNRVGVGTDAPRATLEVNGDMITKGPSVDIRAYGAIADGVTDASTAIQDAIDSLATNGGTSTGGTVLIPPGPFAISSTVVLRSNVLVHLSPGTEIRWIGALDGTMFTTDTAAPTLRTGVIGDRGSKIRPMTKAALVFDLHSVQFSQFGNFEVTNGLATTTVFQLLTDATSTTGGYKGKKNTAFNTFLPIVVSGNVGTVIEINGESSSAPVTLNTFGSMDAPDVKVAGIRIVQWADNNEFLGQTRFSLTQSDAVGIIFNDSATPASEVGIYSNTFTSVAIDTFAGSFTGRKGLVFNHSKRTTIYNFHQNPEAEGGSIVNNYAKSYYVVDTSRVDGIGAIQLRHHNLVHANSFAVSGSLLILANGSLGATTADAGIALEVVGTISGAGLSVGGSSTVITGMRSTSVTLDFPNSASNNSCNDLTATVSGAVAGDVVSIGAPSASLLSQATVFGYVSAPNTVTIRYCRNGTSGNPASGTYKILVTHF